MTGGERETGRSPGDTADAAEPLSDLAELVSERRERSGESAVDALFHERSFDASGTESAWDGATGSRDSAFGAIGEVIEEGERTYVVSKRNFCERCRYFSPPPAVGCSHEGTQLREFVDTDHVRVHSCPIVRERRIADDGTSR